ncbi:putative sporulation protein YtxC [Bacillus sp. FJAT-45037]|uniref:putative sporulation protein YtxC n=1 Tax=Bacillus sp. FJAT-45037 TaxID=2011007 RepID=UPI000C23CA6D|nr:putative sporulation protein YtxC [Bacillus sp. FJAT-45037]
MIAIHFEEERDCKELYQLLHEYIERYASFGLGGKVESNEREMLVVDYTNEQVNFYDSFHPLLTSVLTEHVIKTREAEWILDIIESIFHFTDEDEQQQILTIARTILDGNRNDLPSLVPFFNRYAYIYDAFAKNLEEETTFYYDPFLTFRLREYGEMLIDCVEIAIDEYMFEQEYQNMIEDFRQYVQVKPVKFEVIYVVHDQEFTFYDEHFRELPKDVVLFHLEEKIVFEEAIEFDQMVISPLVSMVPNVVHVFSDEPDHGVVLTIQAIFQERMKVYPYHQYEKKRLQ